MGNDFDDLDFSFDEFDMDDVVPAPKEETKPIVVAAIVTTKGADLVSNQAIYNTRQIPPSFKANIENEFTKFLFDIHTLIICKAYNSLKNPGMVCESIIPAKHTDLLSSYCNILLKKVEKADQMKISVPDSYNVFSYLADLKIYMGSISSRIDDTNINQLTYTKNKFTSGLVKKMIDSILVSGEHLIDIPVDYTKGRLIGLFLATTGYHLDMTTNPNKIISRISAFIDEVNSFPGSFVSPE